MSEEINKKDDTSVLVVLQDIKKGSLDPRNIEKSARKEIVNLLRLEGYTIQSIAQILKCSDKTVQRVVVEIKKDNQVSTSPEFVKETIGEMLKVSAQHWSSLMRIARNVSSTTREKIDAELSAWNVFRDYVEELRRIGYLPSAAQEVFGNFSHHIEDSQKKTWDDIQAEVAEYETIAKETNVMTPFIEKELFSLNQTIEKGKVEEKIKLISNSQHLIIEEKNDGKT